MKNNHIIEASSKHPNRNMLTNLIKKLTTRISRLFEPEEVEVTFKVEGKNVTYTYTKVQHKQVA